MTILEEKLYNLKNKLSILLTRLAKIDVSNIVSIPIKLSEMVLGENKLVDFVEDGGLVDLNADDFSFKTQISQYDFYKYTNLRSIIVPDNITSIANGAFSSCTNLESITIPFVGESNQSGSANTYLGYIFGATDYNDNDDYIPSRLKEVVITYPCKAIGDYAFNNCKYIKSITIPDSVTSIGSGAFDGCTSLTDVYVADVESWLNISFSNSLSNPMCYAENLYFGNELVKDIIIPDSVTSIGFYAFGDCTSLTSITIPDSVTNIGRSAFSGCTSLASITIPDSVTSIGYSAFNGCTNLASITIPDGVTSIGSSVFSHCENLTSVTIPDSVTSIGYMAFFWCKSLTSITIPDSVTIIDYMAFYNCDSFTSIVIPDSVTTIGGNAFSECSELTDIYLYPTTPPSLGNTSAIPTTTTIHVPVGCGDAYKSATNWSYYASQIVEDIEI